MPAAAKGLLLVQSSRSSATVAHLTLGEPNEDVETPLEVRAEAATALREGRGSLSDHQPRMTFPVLRGPGLKGAIAFRGPALLLSCGDGQPKPRFVKLSPTFQYAVMHRSAVVRRCGG